MSADGEGGGREVAYRLFAAEYDDATLSHTESDEERAPNYVVTPTGARVNRLFVVGTLTEVSRVNEEMVRARVVDPTGAFVVYAGQYQPDELAFLERADPPSFVAVTGKARTFEPEDGDRIYTSVRPESVATVDADTRDRWVVSAAEQTLERIGAYAHAADVDAAGDDLADALLEAGLEEGLARGIPLAQDHYGTTPAYLEALREQSLDAVRVVADERDQVGPFGIDPDDTGPDAATFADLAATVDLELDADLASTPAAVDEPESESAPDAAAAASETSAPGAAAGTAMADDEPGPATVDDDSTGDGTGGVTVETVADEPLDAGDGDDLGEFDAGDGDDLDEFDAGDGDDLDEFDAGDGDDLDESDADDEDDEDDLGEFEAGTDEMYEMDDEEREELEEKFGAEFTTGAEVDEPGETGIDVPEPDAGAEADDAADGAEPADADGDGDAEPEPEPAEAAPDADAESEPDAGELESESDEESDEPDAGEADADLEVDDLQAYVVETMTELDDGDGADRETVVVTVSEDTGASVDEIEDAIQDALMEGQCFEPDGETLKAI